MHFHSENRAPTASIASILIWLIIIMMLHGYIVSLNVNYLMSLGLCHSLLALNVLSASVVRFASWRAFELTASLCVV